jgi:hypothetical protein
MKRTMLLGVLGGLSLTAAAVAQQPPASAPQPAPSSSQPASNAARPDANYPKPSGQDSQPSRTTPKQAPGSSPDNGTVQSQGAQHANQSGQVKSLEKHPTYKGNTGKKKDPGTACSTARPTKNGGVDCGTGGEGATPGKVPKS